MTNQETTWQEAFNARDDLEQYGDNAIGLFALALRFEIDDVHTVAAESITDGSDDKKCDLIFIDPDEGVAVVAQCYMSSKERRSAPANKASDLNTAIAWLLQRPIRDLPDRLKSAAAELRSSIQGGTVTRFEAWYVHNLPESQNVRDELNTVEATAQAALNAVFPDCRIAIGTSEIGTTGFEDLYRETLSPILVGDEFKIEIEDGFSVRTEAWQAYVTAIPARFLHRIYNKRGTCKTPIPRLVFRISGRNSRCGRAISGKMKFSKSHRTPAKWILFHAN